MYVKMDLTKGIFLLFGIICFTHFNYSQPLNGNYTVGGTSPDFATLQDAAHALFINGMSGPVNIYIRPGTYFRESLPGPVLALDTAITGISSANRLTFQSDIAAGGNVDNVVLQIDCDSNSNYNDDRMLIYLQSDYTTFRNLTFKDADSIDTPTRWLIRISPFWPKPTIDGIEFDGCKFWGTPYYDLGSNGQYGTTYGVEGSSISQASVTNCQFRNLNGALAMNVNSAPMNSVIIENNRFSNLFPISSNTGAVNGGAIYASFTSTIIRKNFIGSSTGRNGIEVASPVNGIIEANYITGNFWSGQLFIQGSNVTDSIVVKNNIIIGGADYGAIYVTTDNTRIYHNTIDNIRNSGQTLAVSGAQCSVMNNIFLDFNTGITFEIGSNAVDVVSDHNVFYRSETVGNFAQVNGAYYTTFDDYRFATGKDPNSNFTDVEFEFDSLGIHIDECQAQDQRLNGIHLDDVPVDYYGALRDSVKPFVGAVEGARIPFDMFGDPYRTAVTGYPLSVAEGRFDNLSFAGIAVPDWDNRKILLFHNNGATRTFTQSGTLYTGFKPTVVKLYDLDEDNNLDLITAGDTSESSLEVFWGDGSGGFTGPDIVATSGRVRSLEPGPVFADFSTIVTTEDNGFLPGSSFIGFTTCTAERQLCHELTNEPNPPDTVYAVMNDFVLANVGGTGNIPSLIAPGIFGTTSPVPELYAFDLTSPADPASNCTLSQTDFWISENEYNFPVTGYYTNSSSIIMGDFNDDGENDFITTGWDDNYCVFVKGGGGLTFTADTIVSSGTRGLVKLDYENDGDPDFVTINNTLDSAGITIFLNDGTGNFIEKKNCYFPYASGHPNGIVAEDFDNDGRTDVAVVSRTEGGGDSLFVLYNLGGLNTPTGIRPEKNNNIIPDKFELSQNYPNPFNPSTRINFNMPIASNVKIFVYNVLGEKVRELLNGQVETGEHTIIFNAGNLASGIYIYQLIAETLTDNILYTAARKMVLTK